MPEVVPVHLAIICDGNRRWARDHKLEVFQGHERAVNGVFEPLIDHAVKRGIKFLTFWIFGTDNWNRDPAEVEGLMNLFRSFFDRQVQELHAKGVRVNMIGDLSRFAPDIQERVRDGVAKTKRNSAITVTLAMNYGGRDEIIRAIKKMYRATKAGRLVIDDLTPDIFHQFLDTADLPDPELIVRTSGEQRLSGFMMWQMEYAEFWFPNFHFPEFTPERLDEAIVEFNRRKRRFGK